MILPIRYYGDPVLRKKAEQIQEITDEIRKTAEDLVESLYAEKGLGLAAPQVGISIRMIAIDAGEKRGDAFVLINPVVTKADKEVIMEEGCLSFPGIFGKISRPSRIEIKALRITGEEVQLNLDGLECRAVLHEIDHLDGVLFIDRMSSVHKIVIAPKLKKLIKVRRSEPV
ncbi:MAG: peptide deformylase [Candidatus Aureabacteria bacterium]|nr:peptide deformylase [Candidatus Auribacterota bacterium]